MIILLPLRGMNHRILISDDGVTFVDPRVSPPLTAHEREYALTAAAIQRRTAEPAERLFTQARDGFRRAAAVAAGVGIATFAHVGLARAEGGPLDMETGGYLVIGCGIVAAIWLIAKHFRPESADPEPMSDLDDDWDTPDQARRLYGP